MSPPDVEQPPPIPYELRIGVTGHCTIEEPDELAKAVRELVCDRLVAVLLADGVPPPGAPVPISRRFFRAITWLLSYGTAPFGWLGFENIVVPHAPAAPPADRRTPVDLTVVTSLAPGSDQIAARAITECVEYPQQRNRYLEAVLPIPADEYLTRIERQQDREEFAALLALDRGNQNTHPKPTVIYPRFDEEPDPEHPAQALPLWKAYRDAGRHVVDASEIVLAIWDPKRPANPGGTEATIAQALAKGRLVLWLDPSDLARGPRRLLALDEKSAGAGPPVYQVESAPETAKSLSRNYHRLAAFNRDPAWDPRVYRRVLKRETAHLRDAAAALPQEVSAVLEKTLLPHVARADQLAMRYHGLRNFVKVLLPAVSALAISFIAFQIFFLPHRPELAAIEILLLLTGYLSYRLSVHEAWHEKWLYDRHLTERLRALLYTGLVRSGRPDPTRRNLLPFYRPTNEWFTSTLARFGGRLKRTLPRTFDPAAHLDAVRTFVCKGWIEEQIQHYERSRENAETAGARSKAVTYWMLASVLAVATAHAFGVGHGEYHDAIPDPSRIDLWIAFLTITVPAWGGALHVIDAVEDHHRMAERAELMATSLRGVRTRLDGAGTLQDLEEKLMDARQIIELEGEEWAASMRQRAPEVHV